MTTTILSVAAATGALALLVLALTAARRARGTTDARLAAALAEMNARMETLARDLSGALEEAREEGRRSRVLGELGGSIDLDEVLTRILEAAGALPREGRRQGHGRRLRRVRAAGQLAPLSAGKRVGLLAAVLRHRWDTPAPEQERRRPRARHSVRHGAVALRRHAYSVVSGSHRRWSERGTWTEGGLSAALRHTSS